ncbi:MAG TPA: nitrile hydratase accessory protein [Myxococcota bacterium]|nr:nitrile hydratase accessory protein [Myxococcota bacterium]
MANPTLALAGAEAPPRRNGELVFEAPWESRLFGVTLALFEAGLFGWEEFRQLLCDEIRAWEAEGHPKESWSYYARWQAAFERLLAEKGICAASELESCARALAARPAGHDHAHLHAAEHERTR